jgi:hypothetical protein
MSALPSRRRRRALVASLAGLVVMATAPVLGYAGLKTLKNSKEGTAVATLPVVKFPSTPTAMLATIDAQQVVTSITVMVLDGGGRGGTIVTVPTNTDRSQSSEEAHLPIADSVINFGPEGFLSDIESISYLTLETPVIADAPTVATYLAPLGPLSVDLRSDVVAVQPDGNNKTLFSTGVTEMSADQAASVLVARDPANPETKRLGNVRAVWNAVAESIGKGRDVGAIPEGDPTTMTDFMNRMFAGPVQVYNGLNTRLLKEAQNPTKIDVGELDSSTVVLVMAGLAPTAMSAPTLRPSFRIENGFSEADLKGLNMTPTDVDFNAVARLRFDGGNILSISDLITSLPPDQELPEKTVILVANELKAEDIKVFGRLFGDVVYQTPAFGYPTVDVTIVLGRSYLETIKG